MLRNKKYNHVNKQPFYKTVLRTPSEYFCTEYKYIHKYIHKRNIPEIQDNPFMFGFYTVFFKRILFIRITRFKICQKIKNILRIMARLKYMIKNLESPILILHQESALFTMECLLFTMEGLQFRKTCVRNQHTNQSKHS